MIFSNSTGVSRTLGVLAFSLPVAILSACSDAGTSATKPSAATLSEVPVQGQFEQDPPTVFSAIPPVAPERFFFDVNGHSQAEVQTLLERTNEVYEAALAESREAPEVTMVLHGPDVKYFASSNYADNRKLVDLAAKLDAFGFIDLKVCAISTQSMGIAESDYPKFIEVVPYGPGAVAKLRQQGVPQL